MFEQGNKMSLFDQVKAVFKKEEQGQPEHWLGLGTMAKVKPTDKCL